MKKQMKKIVIVALIIALIVSVVPVWFFWDSIFISSDTLYERINVGDNGIWHIYDGYWLGQTFTVGVTGANEDHFVTSVKLKIYRIGSPGVGVVAICTVDADGKPDEYTSAILNPNFNNLGTTPPSDFVEYTFPSPTTLLRDTQYALLVYAPEGDSGYNCVAWRLDTGVAYDGSSFVLSDNSGGSWTLNTGFDFMFEEYGIVVETSPDIGVTYTMTVLTFPNNCDVNLLGVGVVNSGDDGIAVFEDVPYGSYDVTVSKTGYPTFTETVVVSDDVVISADIESERYLIPTALLIIAGIIIGLVVYCYKKKIIRF